MVSIDELNDDEEFSDLKEDVEEECKRFGKVVDLVIPRPQVRSSCACSNGASWNTQSI